MFKTFNFTGPWLAKIPRSLVALQLCRLAWGVQNGPFQSGSGPLH
jgi:hypothetical protein